MKKLLLVLAATSLMLGAIATARAEYIVKHDFETSWTGDYAPGWENTDYRHGTPPVGKMMEQVSGGYTGNGMKLTADSVPEDWMWWAGVSVTGVDANAMKKEYDPWVSVRYYDEGSSPTANDAAGQLMAVPSWVNPYTGAGEDWTDIQFGARDDVEDNYYYVSCGEDMVGWVDTEESRDSGWHQLKMQLSSTDGYVHFYLDDVEVGTSHRNDYEDLMGLGLYTRFAAPLSVWDPKPSTLWDDFEFGSSVPEPTTVAGLIGLLATGGALCWRRRKRRATRAPWSDENRQAIRQIVDHGRTSA